MVSVLDRKVLRDLWHLRGQMAAVALIVACGVASIVTIRTAYDSLRGSLDAYYRDYRFADVFASLRRAPNALATRIGALPGVAAVQTRVVAHVTLAVPGLAEPATGRLVSVPETRAPMLNDLHLRQGRYLAAGRPDEVIASEQFAQANRLQVGDTLGAIINGRWQRLRIVGIALSPEFVYQISPGWFFPDDKRYGVFWMGHDALATAFDLQGGFNDVALRLLPGADEADVIAGLDRLLAPYGALGAIGRADHQSNRFITDEISQLRVSGAVVPAIFLCVAAFLVHIVLARLVATQRPQIGVLKAFGRSNVEVGLHYAKLVIGVELLGAAAGAAFGLWLGGRLTALYAAYYRFPVLHFTAGWGVLGLATLVSAGSGLLGALTAVRRAVRLPPAEAMRPEPPPRYRRGVLEALGVHRLFGPVGRMVLRTLERRPGRALVTAVGIGLACGIIVLGRFTLDSIEALADFEFNIRERQAVGINFTEPRPARVRDELRHLPGVLQTEAYRTVPVRLVAGHRSRRTAILGLEPEAELRQVADFDGRRRPLPAEGLLLTDKLAQVLRVAPGDALTVEVLEGARPTRLVPVVGLVKEPMGTLAYMDAGGLHRLLREGGTVSGAALAVDQRRVAELYDVLKRMPAVAGVSIRGPTVQSFDETLARSHGMVTTYIVGFAVLIAFGVVYNTARIALSERARELASLRVLGFTRAETSRILLDEQAVLVLAAMPLGFVWGYGGAALLVLAFDTELYRLPFVLHAATYTYAVCVIVIAAAVSALIVRRRIDRLDLVAVLKTGD
jgi:putative ABC transport system permease protein